MRVIVVGLGVQGEKRRRIAGTDCVAVVDPFHPDADYQQVLDVPQDLYDAALVCTPDEAKIDILEALLKAGKHVLVEKPLLSTNPGDLNRLKSLSQTHKAACYTAYNHRFEPHFVKMADALQADTLGDIYSLRLFYGNGTARLVRDSAWRDQGSGVLKDLGSHLLDTILFWIGKPDHPFALTAANRFENKAPDHCIISARGTPYIELEMTLLSWRNHFTAEVVGSKGSASISSLCKWGPSTFTLRDRKLPSGRPDEEAQTLIQPDPTWALEYAFFQTLCDSAGNNLDNDIWIEETLSRLGAEAAEGEA